MFAHCYCRGGPANKQFTPLNGEDEGALYNLNNNRFTGRPLPTSSLPPHCGTQGPMIYNNNWPVAHTMGHPAFNTGTLEECGDQPPPPYQPLPGRVMTPPPVAAYPTAQYPTAQYPTGRVLTPPPSQHEYDEIHIMRTAALPPLTNNGYHSTFRLNTEPPPVLPSRGTPPQGRVTPPTLQQGTPPSLPGRGTPSLYDRMNSPHRTAPSSPGTWAQGNSDI